MDNLTQAQRTLNMRLIRATNTQPELVVRRALYKLGLRFRVHSKDLPGRPDIALKRFATVVFVHGCYWHRHRGCRRVFTPSTNRVFWTKKFDRNVQRDKKVMAMLKRAGWKVIVVWECQTKTTAIARLEKRLGKLFHRVLR